MKNIVSLSAACVGFAVCSVAHGADRPYIEYLNAPGGVSTLPFSDAVRVGELLYVSGKIGTVPGTRTLATGGIKEEARQTMENVKRSVEAHGYAMKDVVKCTAILTDMSEFAAFNEVYVSFFGKPYPARTSMGASALSLSAHVEVECIAAKAK